MPTQISVNSSLHHHLYSAPSVESKTLNSHIVEGEDTNVKKANQPIQVFYDLENLDEMMETSSALQISPQLKNIAVKEYRSIYLAKRFLLQIYSKTEMQTVRDFCSPHIQIKDSLHDYSSKCSVSSFHKQEKSMTCEISLKDFIEKIQLLRDSLPDLRIVEWNALFSKEGRVCAHCVIGGTHSGKPYALGRKEDIGPTDRSAQWHVTYIIEMDSGDRVESLLVCGDRWNQYLQLGWTN